MSNSIDLPLEEEDRLAEPPLIDSLHYEQEADGFSLIYIPSIGDDATQMVFVKRDTAEGRMISAYLYRIQALIGHSVAKVVHRGGGNYTLQLANGGILTLSDETAAERWTPEVFERLKQIAGVAEAAFAILHATHH